MSAPLKKLLTDLTRLDGVKGALVVSKDGMVLDAVVPAKDIDAEDLGASVTQAVAVAEKIGGSFDLGNLSMFSVEYDDGMIVIGDLGDNFVMVIADKNAMVGMLRNEIRKMKGKIKALV
ncbi:MAG: roadblock/LC7 domain-containing protein [Desulfurococcales archaeon]|nr:roadblock/LC7 domain-containing protein [Desulfurococcales archaeon]